MHIYTCDDGVQVPSVTTILQIIGVKELIKWANYLGFKHIDYESELQRTADIGTKLHTCLQHIVDSSLSEIEITFKDKIEEDYYNRITDRFIREMSKYPYKTIFTEKTFTSSKLGYGGTIDWFAEMSNINMLNDFKSSKKVRFKHLLQLGGYYNLLKEKSYRVDGGSIILVNVNQCSLYPINEEVLSYLGEVFNKIYLVYKEIIDTEIPKYDLELLKKLQGK